MLTSLIIMSNVNNAALIIPGRRENVDSEAYRRVGNFFEERSIKPIYIQPNWKLKSVTELLNDTSTKVKRSINDKDEIYAFGFSMGAMFALICASQIPFKKSILCSMAFFKEEIPHLGMILKFFTQKMTYAGEEPFSHPKVISGQHFSFIYGEKELKSIPQEIIEKRSEIFGAGETIIAESAGHNIAHKGYLQAIKSTILDL